MANIHYDPEMGQDSYSTPYGLAGTSSAKSLTTFTNVAAAAVSLALIAGVGVWGYQLMARDVSGIPVVRAASGEMRIRPEDPGGQLALNQGLSVNAVAAEGSAGAPADRLILAPRPVDLSDEDVPVLASVPSASVVSEQQSQPADAPDIAAALQSGSVEELVSQLTAGVDRIDEATDAAVAEVMAASAPIVAPAPLRAVLDAPGLRRSLRPNLRPLTAPAVVVATRAVAVAETEEIDSATLATGTRLVQLGAFDTPEIARSQWTRIEDRFGNYMTGKARIVQKAQSGGRTFYRLRAHGFTDLSDARRFCSALVAEGADCIPVVTR